MSEEDEDAIGELIRGRIGCGVPVACLEQLLNTRIREPAGALSASPEVSLFNMCFPVEKS